MRGFSLVRYIFVLLLFVGGRSLHAQDCWPEVSNAKPNLGGNFPGHTIPEDDDWYSSGSSLKLMKDLNMSGTFTIRKGAKLKIENNTGKTLYLNNVADNLKNMFSVADGGVLHIVGTNGKIIIDGGANFTWEKYTLTKGSGGKSLTHSAIYCRGTLILENVEIRNMDITTADHSAIKIHPVEANMLGHGKTTIKNTVITKCKAYAGPALIIHGNGTPTEDAYTADYCAVTLDNVNINKCYSKDSGKTWCGIVRANGQFVGNLNINDCDISYNYADGGCAGIFWNGAGRTDTKCTFTGENNLHHNISAMQGGAIRIETTVDFKNGKTKIYENHAGTIGGGIHVYGYAGGLITQKRDLVYNLSSVLDVYNNTANNGGAGIAFEYTDACKLPDGSTVTADINGAQIHGNRVLDTEAAFDNGDVNAGDEVGFGGGIYFKNIVPDGHADIKKDDIEIHLNSGNIYGNIANKGGGLYVNHTDVGCVSNDMIYIHDNQAEVHGGAIYVNTGHLEMNYSEVRNNFANDAGGGMYVEHGDITISKDAMITNNGMYGGKKTTNGGGVYLLHGMLKMADGEISNNTCEGRGGGLYVYSEAKAISEISGGVIHHNSAKYGGGIAIEGYSGIDVRSVDIQYNRAENGGGVFLSGKDVPEAVAAMKYYGGLIRNNSAVGAMGDGNTGYQKEPSEITGYGAGIYMDNYSMLEFVDATHIGIYDNLADTGADDIFSSGVSTKIELPNVDKMMLEGFDTNLDIPRLYWMEDYCRADPNYSMGTRKITDMAAHGPNDRYVVYRKNLSEHYHVLESETDLNITNKYANIALGYPLVYLSIDKYGMKAGENAVFAIEWKNTQTNTYVPYMNVVVSKPLKRDGVEVYDSQGNPILSEKVALIEGEWRITEKDWSWGYKLTEPADKLYVVKILNTFSPDDYSEDTGSGYTGRRAKFVNTKEYSIEEALEHSEAISENIFDGTNP